MDQLSKSHCSKPRCNPTRFLQQNKPCSQLSLRICQAQLGSGLRYASKSIWVVHDAADPDHEVTRKVVLHSFLLEAVALTGLLHPAETIPSGLILLVLFLVPPRQISKILCTPEIPRTILGKHRPSELQGRHTHEHIPIALKPRLPGLRPIPQKHVVARKPILRLAEFCLPRTGSAMVWQPTFTDLRSFQTPSQH